jgi:hypothetical protein
MSTTPRKKTIYSPKKEILYSDSIILAEKSFQTDSIFDRFCLASIYIKTEDVEKIEKAIKIFHDIKNESEIYKVQSIYYLSYGNSLLGNFIESKM